MNDLISRNFSIEIVIQCCSFMKFSKKLWVIFTKFLIISGNRKCGRDNCVTCDLVITGTSFRSTMTGKEYKFMPSVGCETNNIIYMVSFF